MIMEPRLRPNSGGEARGVCGFADFLFRSIAAVVVHDDAHLAGDSRQSYGSTLVDVPKTGCTTNCNRLFSVQ